MTTYYAAQGGSRILNASRVDQSGSDNVGVTNWTKTNDFILAVNINSAGKETVAAQYKLRWRVSGGSFADVAATGAIKFGTTDLVNGATIAVGGRKCSSIGADTWQSGFEVEGTALSGSIDLADEYETEIHFSLSPADAAQSTLYEFELYDATVGATRGTCGATLTTKVSAPAVSTSSCTDIAANSATGNGNITSLGDSAVTRRGFCYMLGTTGDPTTANSVAYDDSAGFTTGAYTKSITGLAIGTNYRVRAYAVNSDGTGYGTTVQLTTSSFVAPGLLASGFLADADRSLLTTSGSWATTSALSRGMRQNASAGNALNALNFGGVSSDDAAVVNYTDIWSGSSWATTTAMLQARGYLSGCGTTSDALNYGGSSSNESGFYNNTEIWSGTAWATTTALLLARDKYASCGTTSNALCFGGVTATGLLTSTSELWSGSSWATTAALTFVLTNHAGCGTSTAALCVGGYSGGYSSKTQIWSGSSWATTGELPAAKMYVFGCGTTGGALCIGGYSNSTYLTETNLWAGSSWATTVPINSAVGQASAAGSHATALSMGGFGTGTSYTTNTEKWTGPVTNITHSMTSPIIVATQIGTEGVNPSASSFKLQWRNVTDAGSFADVASTGQIAWATTSGVLSDGTTIEGPTGWATTSSLNQARWLLAGCGTTTDALSFGGYTDAYPSVAITEKWSGSSWATTASLPQAKSGVAGCGIVSAALCFGGRTAASSGQVATTGIWNGSTWATTTILNEARYEFAGCGTTTAALSLCGFSSNYSSRIELWSGNSWATTTSAVYVRSCLAGCGTTTAALIFSGSYTQTEIWNGSSWATTSVMNVNSSGACGCGDTSNALSYNGATVEKWNGSSWATTSAMVISGLNYSGGCGNVSSALVFGGYTSARVATTQKWSIGANTRRLPAVSTMSWQDGLESVGDNLLPDATTLDLGSDYYTELQWALNPSGGHDGDTYEFRLYSVTGSVAVGTCTVTLTLVFYVYPGLLASRILLDSDRSSISTSDNASVINHQKSAPIIVATAIGKIAETPGCSYKLQWRWRSGWTTTSALTQIKSYGSGSGTADAALSYGGTTSNTTGFSKTEIWTGAAWATTSNMPYAPFQLAGCGTTTATLAVGGTTGAAVATTALWSGSSWATTTSLPATRYFHAGCGTTTDALMIAGLETGAFVKNTLLWNGASWSTASGGDLVSNRLRFGACGTTSAAICAGGDTNGSATACATTEIWAGASWATTTVLPATRQETNMFGSTSAAINVGGYGPSATCYSWINNAWATFYSLNGTFSCPANSGNASSGLIFGGSSGGAHIDKVERLVNVQFADVASTGEVKWSASSGVLSDGTAVTSSTKRCLPSGYMAWATTTAKNSSNSGYAADGDLASTFFFGANPSEKWNGSSWATTTAITVTSWLLAGCGNTTDALAFGGQGGSWDSTTKWSGSSWATTTVLLQARHALGGCGTTTNALSIGGYNGGIALWYLANTERWSGSSWATTAALNLKRRRFGSGGTTSALLCFGGDAVTINSATTGTEIWSGSSWATTTAMNIAKLQTAGCGTTTDALNFCGSTSTWDNNVCSYTEIWSGSSWATTSQLNTASRLSSGTGSVPNALSINITVEKFIECSWQDGLENLGDNLLPDAGSLDLAANYYTELQWGLSLTDATVDIAYEFALYNITQAALTGACLSTIMVIDLALSFIMIIDDEIYTE